MTDVDTFKFEGMEPYDKRWRSVPSGSGIYILTCPINGDLGYIGRSHNIRSRVKGHVRLAHGSALVRRRVLSPLDTWLMALANRDLSPTIHAMIIGGTYLHEVETQIIRRMGVRHRLLNISENLRPPFEHGNLPDNGYYWSLGDAIQRIETEA